ncbi:MAG TPA: hypothetical protein VK540_17000 [Polyangiaceae bacterium]|nr:hypothetical protein [Polyangiaceae bacterium]
MASHLVHGTAHDPLRPAETRRKACLPENGMAALTITAYLWD